MAAGQLIIEVRSMVPGFEGVPSSGDFAVHE
jgi:hypothetical protein